MKRLFLFTGVLLVLSFFFSACKKNKDETTAEKLQHKWTIVNLIINYHDISGDDVQTTPAALGDFIDFNSNGTTYTSKSGGSSGNGTYSLISDTQISIDGDTSTIKTLTSSQFVIYLKEVYSASEYAELTINLKR